MSAGVDCVFLCGCDFTQCVCVCVCGVYMALCQLSMKLSVRAFPVALIALWFWVWEGWMKHQEGWVLKVKSKMIKKDWLLSLSCEIANCFLIF